MVAAIETDELTRDFGALRALDRMSLRVEEGEIFGFLGPNGAGKSTAIRLMLDLIRPTFGRATILGHDCQQDSLAVRALAGQLPGEFRSYSKLTGRETIEFFARVRNLRLNESETLEVAERLDLRLDVKAGQYSRGNRQKLGIVLALMGKPRILILDEPSSGLDPLMQHELYSLLRERARAGTTVFFSSHVMSEVEQVCERVGILRNGELVAVEQVSQLKARSLRHLTVRFTDDAPSAAELEIEGVREIRRESKTLEFEIQGEVDGLVKKLSTFHVVDLESAQPSLEELLMHFYSRNEER
jgi:ABC-2 type transport system ATP-binding protein